MVAEEYNVYWYAYQQKMFLNIIYKTLGLYKKLERVSIWKCIAVLFDKQIFNPFPNSNTFEVYIAYVFPDKKLCTMCTYHKLKD